MNIVFFFRRRRNKLNKFLHRTPVSNSSIPNDPVDWHAHLGMPPGELTGLGMSQCFEMGHTLRKHYLGANDGEDQDSDNNNNDDGNDSLIDGISRSYYPFDYKFYSSDIDRTMVSAWATR